jgi:hypothetical protein
MWCDVSISASPISKLFHVTGVRGPCYSSSWATLISSSWATSAWPISKLFHLICILLLPGVLMTSPLSQFRFFLIFFISLLIFVFQYQVFFRLSIVTVRYLPISIRWRGAGGGRGEGGGTEVRDTCPSASDFFLPYS